MAVAARGFDANVFVNCPFDSDYEPLLKGLLFTVARLGLNPRIASERADASISAAGQRCPPHLPTSPL